MWRGWGEGEEEEFRGRNGGGRVVPLEKVGGEQEARLRSGSYAASKPPSPGSREQPLPIPICQDLSQLQRWLRSK